MVSESDVFQPAMTWDDQPTEKEVSKWLAEGCRLVEGAYWIYLLGPLRNGEEIAIAKWPNPDPLVEENTEPGCCCGD